MINLESHYSKMYHKRSVELDHVSRNSELQSEICRFRIVSLPGTLRQASNLVIIS